MTVNHALKTSRFESDPLHQFKKIRRGYLGKKRLKRVQQLLKETDFVKCVYYGPITLMHRSKILFYDVEFVDKDGNEVVVREFIKSEFRDKLEEIIQILKQRVKIGTEIYVV